MAHFTRAETLGTWVNGYNPTPADMQSFDSRVRQAVDGDGGGSWAPSSTISIGGSGLQLTGPLVVAYGGTLTSGASSGFALNDGDFPQYPVGHPGRTVARAYLPALAKGFPSWLWRVRREDCGLQAYTPSWTTTANGQTTPLLPYAYVPIRAYDQSTISTVVVSFRVGQPHANVPPIMPKIRMCRVDAGGAVSALTSQAAGADVNGYVAIPTPTTGAAWYALGATQSITVTCDQNNVVDLSQYDYHVEIVEEGGLTGDTFVLDRLASPSWQNKLLNAASLPTLWTAPIWQATHSFAAGSVIFPTTSDPAGSLYFINNGSTASSGSAEPAWPTAIGAKVTDGSVTWTALGSTQKFGNIWQLIQVTYTGIVDGHFQ